MRNNISYIFILIAILAMGLVSCTKDSSPTGSNPTGTIGGTVTSAETGLPLSGISIRFFNGFNANNFSSPAASDSTDSLGRWQVTVTVGNYTCVFTGSGIQQTIQNVTVSPGVDTATVQSVPAPVPAGALRIVLNWGLVPDDLDSHLITPGGVYDGTGEVNYYNDIVYNPSFPDTLAYLDHDDTDSYGPETITIIQYPTGKFSYVVDNYSGSPSLSDSSNAIVRVYNSAGQIKSYTVPRHQSDTKYQWHVFNLDGATKIITDVDTVGNINSGAILKVHKKK